LTVSFTDLSTGDYAACAWTFGDGGGSSSCGNPSYQYTTAGVYTVSFSVSGSGGMDTEVKTDYITVYEPPTADFSGDPTSGPAPLTVDFTDLSSGDYVTCAWTFGDGGSSEECTGVGHQYTAAGVYTVSLTVTGPGGWDTEVKTDYITVYEPPTADFAGAPTSGSAPLTVSFTDLSTGDYDSCAWTFGDGGGSGNCTGVSHQYTTAGVYTVTLSISGLGGSDTLTRSNYITAHHAVHADFSGTPVNGPEPLTVDFTNLSSGDYDTCAWNFGDGGSTSNCGNPSYEYTAAGVYTVSLTVSGLGGDDTETRQGYISVWRHVTYLPLILNHR
jgi:PKD repeat protein